MNCMIAGVGGQGTVLASKLIAAAAMEIGMNVRTTETIGMAQRGGSVVSHIRMSNEEIYSPLISMGTADLVIAFEPSEAVRLTPFLAKDALMVVCDNAIKPVTDSLSGGTYNAKDMTDFLKNFNTIILDGEKLISECGAKALNIALLGAASKSNLFPFSADVLEEVIGSKIPEKFLEMNIKAFNVGKELYNETRKI